MVLMNILDYADILMKASIKRLKPWLEWQTADMRFNVKHNISPFSQHTTYVRLYFSNTAHFTFSPLYDLL